MTDRINHVRPLRYALMLAGLLFVAGTAQAEKHPMQKDERTEVKFPPMMREHLLSNMRDHLLALSEIQSALGQGNFKLAADTAKDRLGMDAPTAMDCQPGKAHMSGMAPMREMAPMRDMAKYMPDGMRLAGDAMHRAADQFAADAKAGDYQAAIASLAKVTQACAACHAQYRVR